MNGCNDNNGNRNWNAIYEQWDREQLKEELVSTVKLVHQLRNERNQLQSLVRQLDQENRVQAAELRRLCGGGHAIAAAVEEQEDGRGSDVFESDAESEPVRQHSGRFQVEPVDPDPIKPIKSRGFSEGVEVSMLEQEKREGARGGGSEGMQLAEREMWRQASRREEQHHKHYERGNGMWG